MQILILSKDLCFLGKKALTSFFLFYNKSVIFTFNYYRFIKNAFKTNIQSNKKGENDDTD